MKKIFTLLVLLAIGVPAFAEPTTPRVNITPGSTTLTNNGDSQIFTIELNEPIIVQEEADPHVYIHLTTTDGRISISPATVTYDYNEWSQSKTFTVTKIGNAIPNGENAITVNADVESDSEYYSGFHNEVVVNLAEGSSGSGGAAPITGSGRAIPQTTQWWNHGENKIPFAFTKNLIIGVTDDEVIMLQKFLNAQNFLVAITGPRSPGNETNYYGTQTVRALKNYQGLKGLRTDGIFGPLTRAAANEDLKTGKVIIN